MTMIDRRHDPDPHPPEGLPDRRHCSDKECMEARNRWFTEELLPKLMVRFWIGIGTTVCALAAVFMFLSDVAITRFELKTKGIYEQQATHDKDIDEIKTSVKELSDDVTHSLSAVIDRLDRNYDEIKGKHK